MLGGCGQRTEKTPQVNYYNEFDPDAAAWLGELVSTGGIPEGSVDDRSVAIVAPKDLDGFEQCHFFAGIGGWSYALRLAGWPDDQPVWTASLPCQPFSVAGKGLGEADERHLWPVFRELVRECRPPVLIGEQVSSADGRLWLAGVRADLEGMGYAVAAADLCAAGIGAPHIRQRLYWTAIRLADAHQLTGRKGGQIGGGWNPGGNAESRPGFGGGGNAGRLADGIVPGLEGHAGDESDRNESGRDGADATGSAPEGGQLGRLGYPEDIGSEMRPPLHGEHDREGSGEGRKLDAWTDSYLVECRDGKVRRVPAQPLFLGVVDGLSAILGAGWDKVRGEIKNKLLTHAASSNTTPAEAMRALWSIIYEEEVRFRGDRGHRRIPKAEVLLITLLELSRDPVFVIDVSAPDFQEIQEASLRALLTIPGAQLQLACPPYQPRLDGPSAGELDDTVRSVSPVASQYQAEESVPPMRSGAVPDGIVRGLLQEVAQIWEAYVDSEGGRKRGDVFRDAISTIESFHGYPLAGKTIGRKQLLRGYGNAIVPQLAAQFILSVMDVLRQNKTH